MKTLFHLLLLVSAWTVVEAQIPTQFPQLAPQPTSRPLATQVPGTRQPTPFPTSKAPTRPPTPFPTARPSISPSHMPSVIASATPTNVPSMAPSSMPSDYKRESVIGRVEVMLAPVSSLLVGDTEQLFLEYTIAFLSQSLGEDHLKNFKIEIQRQARQQRRHLQEVEDALFMDLRVTASRILYPSLPSLGEFDFDDILNQLFRDKETEFVALLNSIDNQYFDSIERAGLPVTPSPTTSPTTSAPTAVVDTSEAGGLTEQSLIALIVGASFGVIVLAFLIYHFACSNKSAKKVNSSNPPISEGLSDLEAREALNSPKSNTTDGSSYYGGSIMQVSTAMDNNSYSYSLEPGLEPSVISGSPGQHGEVRPVPMEIPQIDQHQELGHEITMSTSDLQLTESELAMLPSNLAASSSLSGPITPRQTRTVNAPAGKLGIIIDTTVEGPVVHKVNEGSALEGKLAPGDVILSINDIDTRAMSASAITQLMVETGNQERKLVVADNPN